MNEKTPMSHDNVCFQILDFETSNSNSEVSTSNSLKITSYSKTTPLQRESFLTMFYTINLSPLILVTKEGLMLIMIVPLPLNIHTDCMLKFPSSMVKSINSEALQCSSYYELQLLFCTESIIKKL